MCRTFFTKYLPKSHLCFPLSSPPDVCKDTCNQTEQWRSTYRTCFLPSVRQKAPQHWMLAPQRATGVLYELSKVPELSKVQAWHWDKGWNKPCEAVCWSVPGINNLHMPWKRGKVKVLSFLKGPCLPWNASFLVSDSTKSFKLFITDIAVSCTVLFNVSWVFPFLQKNVHVFWFSTVTAVQLMNFHVCCLFCPGFFFWLVGLVGFFNYLIQVIFISLCLLPLCFTSIIITDVPPLPRKQKSPSYFLLDWQNFSFKAHWLH